MANASTRRVDSLRRGDVFAPLDKYCADHCAPLRKAILCGEVRLSALVRSDYPGQQMPRTMLPEVSTVGFWDATSPQHWGLDWHRNEGLELTYLARGRTAFSVENENFTLGSGDMTIMRPWQRHRVGAPNTGPSRLCWLILDVDVRRPDQTWRWPDWLILTPADLKHLTTLLSQNEQAVWHANDEIGSCFERIASLTQTKHPLQVESRLRLYINELFISLRELLEKEKATLDPHLTSTHRNVELFLNRLPHHLEDPWTLPKMAEQCGLSSSAFTQYCCRITNQTPIKYLVHCRVEAAKQLLAVKPSLSITDIAFTCGFQSSQYLATVFRQKTGLSPRAWRETQATSVPSRAI